MKTIHLPRARRGSVLLIVAGLLACDPSKAPVNPDSQAASIEIDLAAATIPVGDETQATATLRNRLGEEMDASAVLWGSRTPSVATVDPSGKTVHIRGVSPGTAIVWAQRAGQRNEVTVTVTGAAERVAVTPATHSMPLGTTLQFQAQVQDARSNPIPNPQVVWSTSSTTLLTVTPTGVVTAVGVGVAQVTATINGRSGSAQVTVTPTAVATVLVAPNPAEATLGRPIQFFPTLKDAAGNVLTGRDVAWTSSNPAVLEINASGLGNAKALGNAVVTATSEGKSGTTQVSVVPQSSLTIEVFPASASIDPGQSQLFMATAKNSSGTVVTGLPVSWASSDPSVATMTSAAVATGMSPGTTTITAIVDGRSGSTTLSVRSPVPTLSAMSPDSVTAGRPNDLTLTLTGTNFTRLSRVRWNGTDRPTEYQSATRLLATVTAADLEEPRTAAVAVFTPAPGGGLTPALKFVVKGRNTGVVGDTVADELRPAGDIDNFKFDGVAGQEVNVYFQSLTGAPSQRFFIELFDPAGNRLGYTASEGDDQTLEAQAFGPVRLPASGTYTVRVQGYNGNEQGQYRFYVMPIALAPEHVARTITVGPVVSEESISPVGDVDEFTFQGVKGQLVNVFFQATSGAASDDLILFLLSPTRGTLKSLQSRGSDRTLDAHVAGTFELPLTGTYTVRVRGYNPSEDGGSYRFQLVQIDPRPETVPGMVAMGPVVTGESLSPRGDTDEFFFLAPAQQEVNVFFQALSGEDRLWLVLHAPDGSALGNTSSRIGDATLEGQGFGPVVLPQAGLYSVQIAGYSGGGYEQGAYRFQVMPINLPPEHADPNVVVGPVVTGEDIAPVGDVDQFTFRATRGQAVNIFFQATSKLPGDYLRLAVIDPAGRVVTVVTSYGNDPSLELRQTGRLVLDQDGTYIFRVRASSWGSRGTYQFRVVPLQ